MSAPPRTRPPAPTPGELALLGLVSPVVATLLSLPLVLLLVPTPGRGSDVWRIAMALGAGLLLQVVVGPAVAGWLALRKERGRGGSGSRRTFLEGSAAGLAWIVAGGLAMRALNLLG